VSRRKHFADAAEHRSSEQAATYDQKHEKTLDKLIDHMRERLDFIGIDWVNDDDDDEGETAAKSASKPKRGVRLLDYACGTGVVSRVCKVSHKTPCSP